MRPREAKWLVPGHTASVTESRLEGIQVFGVPEPLTGLSSDLAMVPSSWCDLGQVAAPL